MSLEIPGTNSANLSGLFSSALNGRGGLRGGTGAFRTERRAARHSEPAPCTFPKGGSTGIRQSANLFAQLTGKKTRMRGVFQGSCDYRDHIRKPHRRAIPYDGCRVEDHGNLPKGTCANWIALAENRRTLPPEIPA